MPAAGNHPAPPIDKLTLADLLGANRGSVIALTATSILAGLTEAGVLAIVAQVANSLALGAHHLNAHIGPLRTHTSVNAALLVAGGLAVARLALQIPLSLIPARIAAALQAGLRTRLITDFTAASWPTQAADREGHFQELMGAQINQSSLSAVQATGLIANGGSAGVLLASALVLNPAAAGIVLVISVALLAMLRPLSAGGKRAARRLSRAQLDHAAGVSEVSRLAEETHVFGVAAAQRVVVGKLIENARQHYFQTQLIMRLVPGIYQSFIYVLLVGGLLMVERFETGGLASLGAVVLLLVRAASYGNNMQTSYQGLKQSLPFVSRVTQASVAYRASKPARGSKALPEISAVAFADVSYEYAPERPAIEHISFEAREGEAIGIVGPSGSGKSTISQILLQLRAPTTGEYLVNGYPASDYSEQDWQRLVAYVPQTPHLIHASVAENIRYFRDIPDEAVERAARLAGIHEEITSWTHGYDTTVGPRADAVSGGQAQRICIARAVAGDPKMLLLDEPTSAVDMRSERLIQDSLLKLKGEVTLFIIAHRISTLDMCDRVMVILDGRLDAFEPFDRIRQHSAYYNTVAHHGDDFAPAP
jgi:ABC-type multidrug transport system fused ATPase/permease subunit